MIKFAVDKKVVNGQTSPKTTLDPELVKSLGLGGKGMPNIKGVIKVDPKHMPNLSTGQSDEVPLLTIKCHLQVFGNGYGLVVTKSL